MSPVLRDVPKSESRVPKTASEMPSRPLRLGERAHFKAVVEITDTQLQVASKRARGGDAGDGTEYAKTCLPVGARNRARRRSSRKL